jgi:hypothetical protein
MMIDGLNVFIAGLEAKWCAFTQQEHAPRAVRLARERAPILARARDFFAYIHGAVQQCIMRCPSGPETTFKM